MAAMAMAAVAAVAGSTPSSASSSHSSCSSSRMVNGGSRRPSSPATAPVATSWMSPAIAASAKRTSPKSHGVSSPSPPNIDDLASRLGLHVAVAGLERLFLSPSHSPLAPVLPSRRRGTEPPDTPPGMSDGGRRPMRVAYQGSRGSYCQEAAAKAFSALPTSQIAAFPCSQMDDAFAALEDGSADRAIIPAENSLDGPIHRNLDLLLRHPRIKLAGELVLPVNHCLLALPGADPAAVARVASHPQALAHCRARLVALGLETQEVPNAANAARALAEGRLDAGTAVVGSRVAAREFGLAVLHENLQDTVSGGNYTRFLQLALGSPNEGGSCTSRGASSAAVGRRKATLAFSLEKGPSELFRAMRAFESRGMSVTRVDHRPNRSGPVRLADCAGTPVAYFDYVFIVEVEEQAVDTAGTGGTPAFDTAVCMLRRMCGFVRVLGRYACETVRR